MTSNLEFLKHHRKYLRAQISKKSNHIELNRASFNKIEINETSAALKELKSKLDQFNERHSEALWNDKGDSEGFEKLLQDDLQSCDTYNHKVFKALAQLEEGSFETVAHHTSEINRIGCQLKLPQLPLPEYSHAEGESLELFLNGFEAIIEKYNLSSYEKFVFLQKQLHKEPLTLIKSIEKSNQSYEVAIELLTKAFASTLNQQYETIQRISKLKLGYKDDPYKYISEIRIIKESFKNLKIDADIIMQYFFWNGLNESFKTQLVQIVNKSKPSLNEIIDNYFEANDRYLNVTKSYKEKSLNQNISSKVLQCSQQSLSDMAKSNLKPTTNLAVNISKNFNSREFKQCALCVADKKKDIDHVISKCNVYVDAKAKLDKLEAMKNCAKCANSNHLTRDCRFHFYKSCFYCNRNHFSYLCRNSEPGKSQSTNKKEKITSKAETNNGSVWFEMEAKHSNCNPASILPTFTIEEARGLKDSGCQLNFVDEKWAKEKKFKIVKECFPLIVNGFNSSKELVTNIVKMKLGNEIIEAVCVPYINILLNLPGLNKIVNTFIDKGYNLADKSLINCGDKISEIKFILGTTSAHCVPESSVVFGEAQKSMYSDTPLGVMLIGNIDRILTNLNKLPSTPNISYNMTSYKTDEKYLGMQTWEENQLEDYKVTDPLNNAAINEIEKEFLFKVDTNKNMESELESAVEDILEDQCKYILASERESYNEQSVDENDKLTRFVISNIKRDEEGRLEVPLLWNGKISHLLAKNQNLSKQILKSNFKRYHKKKDCLKMIDDVFKEQQKLGIIEKIQNLPNFLEEHPNYSFLPHMPVFNFERETTKCRNVFLSNMRELDHSKPLTVSHNNAMHAGPCLNKKLSTTIIQLRFDKELICFDLKKAFLQIKLSESDQSKLLFFWYKNVAKKDFSIVAYKNNRLPFGLKCSPTLLLIALYKILILDSENDEPSLKCLKKQIYDLTYMDNCAYSTNNLTMLGRAYESLNKFFEPYQFSVQQLITSYSPLQRKIDEKLNEATPIENKLFGLIWDRKNDTFSTQKLYLNETASTKRETLKTIASNFDLFNYNGPILNRARLFMHDLQCMKDLGWDIKLSEDRLKEWRNISKQVNSTPQIPLKRFIGERCQSYKLIAFTDSSKTIYGTVIYIQNLESQEISFLLAKNKMVNHQLGAKSIPSLEFQAICLGTETLIDVYKQICDESCVIPIKIVALELFTDSQVCLHWLNSHINKFDKMKNRSIFILNRLNHLCRLCELMPINYGFCVGAENPADYITRPISYKQLVKSNYFHCPKISSSELENTLTITIPNPLALSSEYSEPEYNVLLGGTETVTDNSLFPLDENSLYKSVSIYVKVLTFINKLKLKLKVKYSDKYKHIEILESTQIPSEALRKIILSDQKKHFPEIFCFFTGKNSSKHMPNIVGQLNIFQDKSGLLRVKNKGVCWKDCDGNPQFPILLSKDSLTTEKIITKFHNKMMHSGTYSLLSELRKQFWIPHCFSTVKKILRKCVHCRRFNERTIKLNQNVYREFRLSPSNVPFRYVFLDYLGPFFAFVNGSKTKVYLLCFTCLWSRSINLKICLDLSIKNFLRAFQIHIYEYGTPEQCFSDLGSQIVSGANIISEFLNDASVKQYLDDHGVKSLKFEHYYKGCNKLGGLVEVCVKMVKRLIFGSIKKYVLDYWDFELMICETVHIVNRRPIAFKDALRDNQENEVPTPISPEMLTKGYELISLGIIPNLMPIETMDPDWSSKEPIEHIKDNYSKLRKARQNLKNIYNDEFLVQLMNQATNEKSRYKPKSHKIVEIGDIVLLKDPFSKPSNYPMGRIKETLKNILNEVTDVKVLKGNGEIVKRHVSSIIPLLSSQDCNLKEISSIPAENKNPAQPVKSDKLKLKRRCASVKGEDRTRSMLNNNLA